MRVVLLIAATLVAWGASLAVAESALGPGQFSPSLVAFVLCLVPAVAALLFAEVVARKSPDQLAAAILAGVGIRMFTAVAGTVVLGERLAEAGVSRDRFAGWVVVLYLATMVAEGVLLAKLARSTNPVGAP